MVCAVSDHRALLAVVDVVANRNRARVNCLHAVLSLSM